jgi:hypothetical protein
MRLRPLIPLVLTIGTSDLEVLAEPDTGCESGLVIPALLEHEILSMPSLGPVRVASDQVEYAPHWAGRVELGGREFPVEVVGLGSSFLLGQQVIDEIHLCFEYGRRWVVRFRDGGELSDEYRHSDV